MKNTEWKVTFHDDFVAEFKRYSPDVQDELLASAIIVRTLGPAADRPHVGTLHNPRHPNMKELRFKANNGAEIWRAIFASTRSSKRSYWLPQTSRASIRKSFTKAC
ncbi:type II toxin-antitoxin system RelE/ParE family toxin [Duganella zoogloeoides]|uniref:Type II toxin-antitoxin system RelE/ParE family toxin n=1 Tax=Duganella zoogloeoides TaxID=75659 RepID=A0ABZ0XSA4_9BURK|nr:type II toxin-antitoxin system RelE/ParE family toxin [Duganella zoogloeoides]WQH02624.1 type II toxin-antitoxin system RelE/ParE family toxin [Duganella zoogloeoides]